MAPVYVENYTLCKSHTSDLTWQALHMAEAPSGAFDRYRKNLAILLKAFNMPVIRVAAVAKIQPKQVYNLLNGTHDPRLKSMEKVANVFGLSAWQMLALDMED